MAVYPVAAGHADLSAQKWIPTLYAAKLLIEFYKASTYAAISNTEHEGEIKEQGDTVQIRSLPDITIRRHTKGQNLTYEDPEPSYTTLLIDKGRYWAFKEDLVDKKQSDIADMAAKWSRHAGERLKTGPDGIDVDVLQNIYSSAHASNAGAAAGLESSSYNMGVSGTPLEVTKVNILDVLVDCMSVLDEQNVGELGRWVVLPAWATGLIKKSDLKDASLTGDGTSIMRNGRVGMIDRAEVFMSNNLASSASGGQTASECLFGTKVATTFAMQITETDYIEKNPNAFGSLMRGLAVYGYKVVKPEALGHLHIYKG